jgi:putative peptidoglycan lipid II flippase
MANQNPAIEFGLGFSFPSAVPLWHLAEPIIRELFERGRFGPDDTLRAAGALAAYAFGLPAFVLIKALTPGFFAREDTRTPLYVGIAAIGTNIALNLAFLLGTPLAQVGIALATTLSGWLNAALLATVLWRRRHLIPDRRLKSRTLRTAVAAVGMGIALWLALAWLQPVLAHPSAAGVAALAGLCLLGMLAYGGLAVLLGVLDPADLRVLLRRRTDGGSPPDPAGQA